MCPLQRALESKKLARGRRPAVRIIAFFVSIIKVAGFVLYPHSGASRLHLVRRFQREIPSTSKSCGNYLPAEFLVLLTGANMVTLYYQPENIYGSATP